MKNLKLYIAVPVFLLCAYFIYKLAVPETEVTKNRLSIAGDSLVYSNTEYLKDVRYSKDGTMAFEVPLSEIMEREQKYGPLKSLRIYFYSMNAVTDNGKTYSAVKKMMFVK